MCRVRRDLAGDEVTSDDAGCTAVDRDDIDELGAVEQADAAETDLTGELLIRTEKQLLACLATVPVAQAQPAPGAARKKVLFLTYPGVGSPGSHGHASLPAAEAQAVEYGKAAGFDVTTLKGYEPGVGKQDLKIGRAHV